LGDTDVNYKGLDMSDVLSAKSNGLFLKSNMARVARLESGEKIPKNVFEDINAALVSFEQLEDKIGRSNCLR